MKGTARIALLTLAMGWMPTAAFQDQAAADLMGRWEGTTEILGLNLPMAVEFSQGSEGAVVAHIDIQGAKGIPLTQVRFEEGQVHFELNAGPGLAVWEGRLKEGSIQGRFTQGGASGEFSLTRPKAESEKDEPAEDQAPKPFLEEEVTFENGEITLAGTLTLPLASGPHPAAVMITGSGPQNRDEEIFGFRPFRHIAEHLSAQGVAVLRYDDRGVGGSSGNTQQSTSADFAADVQAAVRLLAGRNDIDSSAIGLIGHSEGGIVAPLAASGASEIAFLVLLAGTALPGDQILLAQGERIVRANGASEEMIAVNRQTQLEIFQAVRTGKGWEEVEQSLRLTLRKGLENMPPQAPSQIADVEKYLDTAVNGQLAFSRSPWFKHFIDFDPAAVLAKVRSPVLALFGELDLQVPAEINIPPLKAALRSAGNSDFTVKTLPGANHLFQKAVTGNPNEYPQLKKEFIDGFLEELSSWILSRVK